LLSVKESFLLGREINRKERRERKQDSLYVSLRLG